MADYRHLTNLEPLPSGEFDDLDKRLIAALGKNGIIGTPQPTLIKSTMDLQSAGIVGLYATYQGLQDVRGQTGWAMELQDFTKLPPMEAKDAV